MRKSKLLLSLESSGGEETEKMLRRVVESYTGVIGGRVGAGSHGVFPRFLVLSLVSESNIVLTPDNVQEEVDE